jgi:hypothetical protein
MAFMATSWKQTASVNVQGDSRAKDHELRPRDWKQLMVCPVTGHPCEGDLAYLVRSTAALERAVYRHDQRKISNAMVTTCAAQ